MAGRNQITDKNNPPQIHSHDLRLAKIFCDGMGYRAGGTLLGRPITDNPYTPSPESKAWNGGWTEADDASPGTLPINNCAVYGTVVDT